MEKPLEAGWVFPKVGWGLSQGITKCDNQFVGDSDTASACICTQVEEGSTRKHAPRSSSNQEKVAPPALALKLAYLVPPYMSLGPFKMLPQGWNSEQVSLSASKSIHSPFKSSTWECSCPPSHSATISAGFRSQKLWGLPSPALKPWAGIPWGGGTFTARYLIFNGHTWL